MYVFEPLSLVPWLRWQMKEPSPGVGVLQTVKVFHPQVSSVGQVPSLDLNLKPSSLRIEIHKKLHKPEA